MRRAKRRDLAKLKEILESAPLSGAY